MPQAGMTLGAVALACCLVVWALKKMFFSSTGRVKAPAGRVRGVVGIMGSGKTLFCVIELYRRLIAGQRVASNFTMRFPCTCGRWHKRKYKDATVHSGRCFTRKAELWQPFQGWEQLALLRDCVVVLDEAHLYAPAVSGYALPISARWAISMCRHNSIDIYWITQHETRVTKTLRDLTTEMVLCRRFLWGCQARSWPPEEFRKPRQWLWSKTYKPKGIAVELYDTMELILPDQKADAEGLVEKLIARSIVPSE